MALQSWQHRRTREGSSRRRPSHADDEDCEFADPFVSFNGRKRFEDNLANLAGGFITESSVRPISSALEGLSYKTKLMVKLRLALPWSPVLAWPWGVEHVLEERDDGTVVVTRHLESWDVSAGEGVRQLFRSGPAGALAKASSSPSKAAPSKLGTKDPIAGPLVAAARSIGMLPEQEADGWAGEPSAWAEADSFTQKLSAFTQQYLSGFKQFVAERVAGEFDAAAVDAAISAEVDRGGVLMYSFTSCPFCKKAKELLDEKGASYVVVELDELSDGAARRARLGARTGRTSVPAIFIDGSYIGGLNDGSPGLAPLDAAGELVPRLKGAGALS
jgi:glutaredoxin 3